MTEDADPEFLGLSERLQRAIDRAFDRGLRLSGKRPTKRRRLNPSRSTASASASRLSTPGGGGFLDDSGGGFIDEGGGFIDEGGGFMPDEGGGFVDDGGGGFIDDGGGGGFVDDDGGGGFVPDEPPSRAVSTPASTSALASASSDRIPLRLVASLLSTLRLPADEDVLAVFRASAEGWGDDEEAGPSKGKSKAIEEAVTRKDFRAVCAALMDGMDEMDVDDEPEPEPESSDDDDEDAFQPSEDEYDDGDDDDGDYGAPQKKPTRGQPAAKATKASGTSRSRRKRDKDLEEEEAPKLSGPQREQAREIWDMLKPDAKGLGASVLGMVEVKKWAREMGEMWSEEEITDMVSLFSSRHEGRGLTFEDFGVVMLRAGLV